MYSHLLFKDIQTSIQKTQPSIDRLNDMVMKLRPAVEKSRVTLKRHPDVDKLEDDCQKLTSRWVNVCNQVIER